MVLYRLDNSSFSKYIDKTIDLGKKLIDDYVKEVRAKTPSSQATLSLVDLAELKGTIPQAFTKFAKSIDTLVTRNEYKTVSNAGQIRRNLQNHRR